MWMVPWAAWENEMKVVGNGGGGVAGGRVGPSSYGLRATTKVRADNKDVSVKQGTEQSGKGAIN